MKKMLLTSTLALSALCCSAIAASNTTSSVSTQITVLKPNQSTFTLTLSSNPTTGYSWYLIKTSKLVKLVSHEYKAPNTKLMGAPGTSVWTFKVAKKAYQAPMVGKVTLVYARPWEIDKATAQTFYFVTQQQG